MILQCLILLCIYAAGELVSEEGSGNTTSFHSCFEMIQNFHSLSFAKGLSNVVDYMAKDKIYTEIQIFSLSVPLAVPIRISQHENRLETVLQQQHQAWVKA